MDTYAWADATRRLCTDPEVSIQAGDALLLVNAEDWNEYVPQYGGDVNELVMWEHPVVRSTDIPRGCVALCLPAQQNADA